MPSSSSSIRSLQSRYERYARSLPSIGPICIGTVIKRKDVRQRAAQTKTYGPYYLWTRKINGKTLSVALSQEQYAELKRAIANQRKLEKTLAKMHHLTQQIIFATKLGVKKRK